MTRVRILTTGVIEIAIQLGLAIGRVAENLLGLIPEVKRATKNRLMAARL